MYFCEVISPCALYNPTLLLQVLFGTADGQVIVMDCHGRMLAHILLHESDGIVNMSWNYPSFLVEDSSESDTDTEDYSPPQGLLLVWEAVDCVMLVKLSRNLRKFCQINWAVQGSLALGF